MRMRLPHERNYQNVLYHSSPFKISSWKYEQRHYNYDRTLTPAGVQYLISQGKLPANTSLLKTATYKMPPKRTIGGTIGDAANFLTGYRSIKDIHSNRKAIRKAESDTKKRGKEYANSSFFGMHWPGTTAEYKRQNQENDETIRKAKEDIAIAKSYFDNNTLPGIVKSLIFKGAQIIAKMFKFVLDTPVQDIPKRALSKGKRIIEDIRDVVLDYEEAHGRDEQYQSETFKARNAYKKARNLATSQ